MTRIDLYEDNGGNLIVVKDGGQPWVLGINGIDAAFQGMFPHDAVAWAAGDWEPNEVDGQEPSEIGYPTCEQVATWQDGTVTVVRHSYGDPVAGFSAQGYLGILEEG